MINKIKSRVYDLIIEQLKKAQFDKRPRERSRANIALKKIDNFYKQAEGELNGRQ